MADHDPLCQWSNTPTHRDRAGCPRCALIARVRADERERTNTVRGHRRIGEDARNDLLNDLRAQVEALPEEWDDARNCAGLIWKSDVLALLDGAQ